MGNIRAAKPLLENNLEAVWNCHSVLDTESRLVRQRRVLDSRFHGNDEDILS